MNGAHDGTAMAPIRVTHVVFDLDGGGLETMVGEMARHWTGSTVVMSIVVLSGREGRVGATIRHLVDTFSVRQTLPIVSMLLPLGLSRAIRRTRPDVVHVHSGSWYMGALAARLARVPRVVYTEHGREHYERPLLRAVDHMASRWTDVIVPVSNRLARYLVAVIGVEPGRVSAIPNGVDVSRFTPGERSGSALGTLGLPENALVLGSLGRLERVKRYDRLVEALASLPATIGGRPVYALVCGEGSERPALEALAVRLGVRERFLLPGWIADRSVAHRLLDVFALTSDSEGMSVSLLEAMSSGTASVVMDVGANAELLGEDLRDQVVAAGDQQRFVDVVGQLLGDDRRRARAGSVAAARALSQYSFDLMLKAYERVYRGAVLPAPRL